MASLTLKDIPDELLELLRQRAKQEDRSLNQQVLELLAGAVATAPSKVAVGEEIASQVVAWRELAGQWSSEQSVQEELDELYGARTLGREVEL